MSDQPRLGYIGIGLMGKPMCLRLLAAGYELTVWNRSRDKLAPVTAKGARAAATRVLCYWRDRVNTPLTLLKALAADPHPAVRLEAVRAASFFRVSEAAEVALASLALPQDRFLTYTLDQTMNTLKPFVK